MPARAASLPTDYVPTGARAEDAGLDLNESVIRWSGWFGTGNPFDYGFEQVLRYLEAKPGDVSWLAEAKMAILRVLPEGHGVIVDSMNLGKMIDMFSGVQAGLEALANFLVHNGRVLFN